MTPNQSLGVMCQRMPSTKEERDNELLSSVRATCQLRF